MPKAAMPELAMPELASTEVSTGVREIDTDIEGLSFLMSRIFDPLVECRRRNGECDRVQCARIAAIRRYVQRGFDRQDQLMARADYPLAADHTADHDALVAQLTAMGDAGICGDRDRHVVREAVLRWMLRHHGGCDRQLANWAVTRRVLSPSS